MCKILATYANTVDILYKKHDTSFRSSINRGGCGSFALSVAKYLQGYDFQIIAIDESKHVIDVHKEKEFNVAIADHYVLQIDGVWYDSEGFHDIDDLLYEYETMHYCEISETYLKQLNFRSNGWNPRYQRSFNKTLHKLSEKYLSKFAIQKTFPL